MASVLALLAFVQRSFPALRPRAHRDQYLGIAPEIAKLRLLDTRLDVIERSRAYLDRKYRLLAAALHLLALSVLATAVTAILDVAGR